MMTRRSPWLAAVLTLALWVGGCAGRQAGGGAAVSLEEAGWLTGKAGYEKAMARRSGSDDPVVLFVEAAWCGYCRHVKKRLGQPVLRGAFEGYAKAALAWDGDDGEKALAKKLGVTGVPTFLVWAPGAEKPVRVRFFRKKDGKWKPVPVERFAKDVAAAARPKKS